MKTSCELRYQGDLLLQHHWNYRKSASILGGITHLCGIGLETVGLDVKESSSNTALCVCAGGARGVCGGWWPPIAVFYITGVRVRRTTAASDASERDGDTTRSEQAAAVTSDHRPDIARLHHADAQYAVSICNGSDVGVQCSGWSGRREGLRQEPWRDDEQGLQYVQQPLLGRPHSDRTAHVHCEKEETVRNSRRVLHSRVYSLPAQLVLRSNKLNVLVVPTSSVCFTWRLVYSLETPFDSMEAHLIEDRSAEGGSSVSSPAMVGQEATSQREVGRARTRGYGRGRGRRRLCACRRKRRRGSPTGNMNLVRNAARAAPVVGTVSPLLTWGRTLNTDLPSVKRDRYAYVSV
ncbi:unnamed protein product [Leptidea sinapis]|uniref:Uncharacterized protein n=1 Tax=Leptidea sinapis TaxID=189913 RepID=A0A5E4PT47_9NEOP|nr:unnamed protein product [Leptidea sinapis]